MIEGGIFITGGAGFLGRGIIQRATDENWPCNITVFSRDEVKHTHLKKQFPHVKTIRGDVAGDFDHLVTAMTGHDVVIHAAATKIIPVAEFNVVQTIRDNVIGSLNVAQAAVYAGIKQCIGISTDKVCHSANRYGATKYLMEGIFQEAQDWNYPTNFYLTRYGNVLDSTASVLGLWTKQYKEEGAIGVTNPNMTRFWLTVDQAVDLILLALRQEPGTITIPMLPALSMGQMADYLFPAIEQNIIGLRPGEKVHEELLTQEEVHRALAFDYEQAFVLYPSGYNINMIEEDSPHYTGYQSNTPSRWITKDELFQMVGWAE